MVITNNKLATILVQDSILYYAKIYGFEGIEDVIKRVYSNIPVLREKFLTELKNLKENYLHAK